MQNLAYGVRISDWSSDVSSSVQRQGEGGRGWPRFGLTPKAPLPSPSGPPAQLACVRRRASQWLASAPPHPLPSQGRELLQEQRVDRSAAGQRVKLLQQAGAGAQDRQSTRLNSSH